MAGRTCSNQLMKVLTTPSKVANALDWRKSMGAAIATVDVHADRIGITISKHPSVAISTTASTSASSTAAPFYSSYSLPIRQRGKRRIPEESRRRLSELVREHKVCGFVVSWPIQRDTGRMGAPCGRTLFAIEELLKSGADEPSSSSSSSSSSLRDSGDLRKPSAPVFTPSRPVCLWDGVHREQPATDAFGRSTAFARPNSCESAGTMHVASEEQYHQDESIVAASVWEDFVRTNWPEVYRQRERQEQEQAETVGPGRSHLGPAVLAA